MSTDVTVHKAVVHSTNETTGICHVKIPSLTGQKIVPVSTEGLTENSQGIWNVPRVGDLCLVAVTQATSPYVSWVTGMYADLYRGDVNGVIEAINGWDIGDIEITNSGALSTDLIISRHILAGQIIADKIASNAVTTIKLDAQAVTTSKLATDAITSLNYTAPPVPGDFAIEGTYLNLANGDFQSQGILMDGVTGDVTLRGSIQASEFNLLDASGDIVAELDTTNLVGALTSGNALKFNHDNAQTITTALTWSDAAALSNTRTVQLRTPAFDGGTDGYTQLQFQSSKGSGTARQSAFLEAVGGTDYTGTASVKASVVNEGFGAGAATIMEAQYPIGGAGAPGGLGEASLHANAVAGTVTLQAGLAGVTSTVTAGASGASYNVPSGYQHDFKVNGTLRARIGATVSSMHGMSIGAFSGDANWTGSLESTGGYLLLGGLYGATSIYLRTNNANPVYIGGNGSNTLTVGSGTSTFSGTVNAATVSASNHIGGYVETAGNCNTAVHSSQNLQIRSSGTHAGLSMWPTNHGIAPVLRCFNGGGEAIACGNNPGTAYAQFEANNYVTWSSLRGKENIKKRKKRDKEEAIGAFRRIETVVYDDKVGETKVAKSPRFSELNKKWIASGKSPLQIKDPERDTVSVEHDCELNDCTGTAESPCGIVRRHRNRRGIVAEELLPVLPQAVSVNMYGEVMGIDYGVVLVEMVDVVQTLLDRVEELESMV